MPIQLNKPSNKISGPGTIDRATVKKMVHAYRQRHKTGKYTLNYAHFAVTELVDLLVSNGILDPLNPNQSAKLSTYGLKVYMANHNNDTNTCPTNRPGYNPYDTVVLCNTELANKATGKVWKDMLKPMQFISIAGAGGIDDEGGSGLDRGSICPPDCDGDQGGNGNEDIETQAS